uniref:BTB domain-containing protein n=1 Tax=Panagrolaimus sp. JU765 TaxID=591449 RepID=A0AC34Q0U9_9BILA
MPDFTDAFSLSKTADIAFCVNGKKILADKFVLYHRSPVFATMFDGPLAPKSENGEKPVIPINDESITAENFKIFLLYLYSDKAEVTGDNAFTLMNLGKMYDVPSLISFVGKFLINNLTSENVVTIANSASIFNDDEILKNSVDFITKKCDVLKSEQQFCQLNEQVLSMVLNKDEGNLFCHSSSVENGLCHICGNAPTFSEIDLFKMLLKWGENQCITKGIQPIPQNLKTVLKEFLPLIRFPTMTINQLVTVVYPTKLFDASAMWNMTIDAQNLIDGQPTSKSGFSYVKRQACSTSAQSQQLQRGERPQSKYRSRDRGGL